MSLVLFECRFGAPVVFGIFPDDGVHRLGGTYLAHVRRRW